MSYSGSTELQHITSNIKDAEIKNLSGNLGSDSREVSKELQRILSEGCTSPLCIDFLNNMDIDGKYEIHCLQKLKLF